MQKRVGGRSRTGIKKKEKGTDLKQSIWGGRF